MLPILLDDQAATAWLRPHLGDNTDVRRQYLRYKPGTSCVVAAELRSELGARQVVLAAYSPSAVAKAEKTLAQAAPEAVLAQDPSGRLLVMTPGADRHLPGLRVLADPRRRVRLARRLLMLERRPAESEVEVTTLSYKPHRRWVGLLRCADRTMVLRCYRPRDAGPAINAATMMSTVPLPTQRVVGVDLERGIVALDFLHGPTLEVRRTAADLRAVGRALATLHAQPVALPPWTPQDETRAVRRAVRQVAQLSPDLAPAAEAAVAAATARLQASAAARMPELVLSHGDFSLDQVVAGREGAAFIDFDRATRGPAEADLGSLAAAALVDGHGHPADILPDVLRGYAEIRPVPGDDAIALWTVGHLLRRAAEPFRSCRTDWSVDMAQIVATATGLLAGAAEGRP